MQPLSAHTSIPRTRKRTGKILSPWSYKMVSLELFCNLVPDGKKKKKIPMTQKGSSESHTEGLSLLKCPTLFQSFYRQKKFSKRI